MLASISFNSFTGESTIPSDWGFLLCLPISGDFFYLFLQFQMLCFANCLCKVNICCRHSVGLSGDISLISLSGCSKVALSSVWVLFLYFSFTCQWLFCWWILPSSRYSGINHFHLVLYVPIFKCPVHNLAFNLHINWYSVDCSLCSLEDWLGFPVG